MRLIGIDGSPYAPGLYNSELFDSTRLNGYTSDDSYWDIIDEIVESERIDLAFVVPEAEVLEWAKRAAAGRLPCRSLLPDHEVAVALYDKHRCFELLQHTDLVPDSLELDRGADAGAAAERLGYPYWVRKGAGAGAAGAFKVASEEDLEHWFEINPAIETLLASEYLPGRNYACKVLYHEGQLLRSACGERIDYLLAHAAPSGISGMCARGRLLNDDALVERSDRALREIYDRHGKVVDGMFTVDFKEDEAGTAKLTEINIRHVSFTHAFSLGGANFAHDTYELLTNGQLSEHRYRPYRFAEGLNFIRGVDTELFVVADDDLRSL